MVLVVCAFDKCGNKRKKYKNTVSFFSFPKNKSVLGEWLEFFNKHNETKLTEETLKREKMKLCHLHFEKDQIVTKSNKDRTLIRLSVPRCPPGIVDQAHVSNKYKNKKAKKPKTSPSGEDENLDKKESVPSPQPTQPDADRCPLYHTVNGYVVDLRIAALQETFRLPNGKLIQVRRQPKKIGCSDPTTPTTPEKIPEQVPEKIPEKKPENKPEKIPERIPYRAKKASKTYANRRTVNQPSPNVTATPTSSKSSSFHGARRAIQSASTRPNVVEQPARAHTLAASSSAPARPAVVNHPPTRAYSLASTPPAPTRRTVDQEPSVAHIAPPTLSTLQALVQKQHDNSPMGNFQKQFENRLISAAEISLHVVSKVNKLVNSNPFKNVANERDLEELYTNVSYVLKYAIDRFKGLEDSCVDDIKQMNSGKQSNRGPDLGGKSDTTANKNTQSANAEEEDDDCAIVEQRTDLIEIFSDDDEDGADSSQHSAKELPVINVPHGQVRISSDTESVQGGDNAESESDAEEENTVAGVTSDTIHDYEITEQTEEEGYESNVVAEESTEIELVMKHDIEETTTEITNIIESYYHEEEDEADEPMDTQEGHHYEEDDAEEEDDDHVMDVYERGEHIVNQGDEEEETEELIEIIEGDVDLDLEDGHEYKVVEIIDGDFYLVTNDNN